LKNTSIFVAAVCERRQFRANPVIGARRAPLQLFWSGLYLFLLPALIAGLGLMLTGQVKAQTFTTLYSFTASSGCFPCTNSDGANPKGLFVSGDTLYGTAWNGGPAANGTVFKVNTDGTGFTNLH